MTCSDKFEKHFGITPDGEVFCPYRICPLGAHTDHNLGLVSGFALDTGVKIAFSSRDDGEIKVKSAQFGFEHGWNINQTPEIKTGDWADYLRGVTLELKKTYNPEYSINAYIDGAFCPGGLSSSAAVTLAFLNALCRVNHITFSEKEYITAAHNAEHNYVGVKCGTLDQSCEVLCRKNKLLFLDTLDGKYSLIEAKKEMKPYEIGIFSSGTGHRLANSKYNVRADELKSAAFSIKAFAGIEQCGFAETYMRDVDRDLFEKYKNHLPDSFGKRAEHWYAECDRVLKGVEAWENGNIDSFGSLMNQSGVSSINLWETGNEELSSLTHILSHTDGVYGARFSGAGFGGCCIAMTDPGEREDITLKVKNEYSRLFPDLEFTAYFCETGDGMKI